jgi:nickel/cobalt transporter (NicO) family protein
MPLMVEVPGMDEASTTTPHPEEPFQRNGVSKDGPKPNSLLKGHPSRRRDAAPQDEERGRSAGTQTEATPHIRQNVTRLIISTSSLMLAVAILSLLNWWLMPAVPTLPQRSPFGVGLREAAPAPGYLGGLGSAMLAWQSGLFRELTRAVTAALREPQAAWVLVSGSFLYGLVHAAGPGHGKMVIASYIVADGRTLKRGMALSAAAALLQALVAITLVAIMALALRATARQVDDVTRLIEMAAFAAIALAGLFVLWRKAGNWSRIGSPDTAACTPGCGHEHLPPPEALTRLQGLSSYQGLREMALIVIAAGSRPCMGAIVVLTFAAAQGLFWVGVASALAMAAGVAIATSALASLAVGFKALALRIAGGRGIRGEKMMLALECLAAALVAALGLLLMAGMASTGA